MQEEKIEKMLHKENKQKLEDEKQAAKTKDKQNEKEERFSFDYNGIQIKLQT
jgi:hypothetical protein